VFGGWTDLMSKKEVKAWFDKGDYNYFGHAGLQMQNYMAQGGKFEPFWKALQENKEHFWKYWFSCAIIEFEDDLRVMTSYVNYIHCQTPCKTCTQPCQVHLKSYRPNADDFFSPWRKDDDKYYIESAERELSYLERRVAEIDVYAVALKSIGVDVNTINPRHELNPPKKKKAKKK